MLKKYLMLALGMAMAMTSGAEVYETIVLNNGDVLEGYVSKQYPDGSIEVYAESCELTLPDGLVEKAEGPTKNCTLVLTRGEQLGLIGAYAEGAEMNVVNGAEILSQKDGIRIRLKKEPRTFSTSFDNVKEINYKPIYDKLANGIEDIVTTTNGMTFTGQIIKKVPGKLVAVKTNTGKAEIPLDQVKHISRRHVDKGSSVFNQTPLVETVELDFGNRLEDVLIVDTDYEDRTFCVVDGNLDLSKPYAIGDIVCITRRVNPNYSPKKGPRAKSTSPAPAKTTGEEEGSTVDAGVSSTRILTVNGKNLTLRKYSNSADKKSFTIRNAGSIATVRPTSGMIRVEYGKDLPGDFIIVPVKQIPGQSVITIPKSDVFGKSVGVSRRYKSDGPSNARNDYSLKTGTYAVLFIKTGEAALFRVSL